MNHCVHILRDDSGKFNYSNCLIKNLSETNSLLHIRNLSEISRSDTLVNQLRMKEYTSFLAEHNRILEEQVRERTAALQEAALAEITKQRGIHFDPQVVDACLCVIRDKGFVFK